MKDTPETTDATPERSIFRIGGGLYDLTDWMDKHPGGRQILELQRDRFDDATYAFEAHHLNQRAVRRQLQRFYVGPAEQPGPGLSATDSFYSEFRRRVRKYLKAHGGSGPTTQGWVVWWITIAGLCASHAIALASGSFWCVIPLVLFAAMAGGYGHNWVHQPKYWHYAYCLDLIGLSSLQWRMSHVLQHHMFTNTPRDNHWKGTAPFMVVDPVKPRTWVQRRLCGLYFFPVLLFGLFANYILNIKSMAMCRQTRREQLSWARVILPGLFVAYGLTWGWAGAAILAISYGLASAWYFTVALSNHNTEASWDLAARARARDWGEAQLQVSSDVGTQRSYLASAQFLWLNYHTVHHLVPSVDQSHHPQIQRILIELCDEHGVSYTCYGFGRMFREMIHTFQSARLLGRSINWKALWSEYQTTLSSAAGPVPVAPIEGPANDPTPATLSAERR